jgi:hypothetical protein
MYPGNAPDLDASRQYFFLEECLISASQSIQSSISTLGDRNAMQYGTYKNPEKNLIQKACSGLFDRIAEHFEIGNNTLILKNCYNQSNNINKYNDSISHFIKWNLLQFVARDINKRYRKQFSM